MGTIPTSYRKPFAYMIPGCKAARAAPSTFPLFIFKDDVLIFDIGDSMQPTE